MTPMKLFTWQSLFLDYRHKESKHLNTTAAPTLDIIPESEKILEIQTGHVKANKRNPIKTITNIDKDAVTQNLNSNVGAGKTQIYSNCFTLSTSVPLETTNSTEPSESDNSNQNNFHSDYDLIEEENYLDEEMFLEPSLSEDSSHTKELLHCETLTEYLRDDTFAETSFSDEKESNCVDNTTKMPDDAITSYVELIETNDETDEECLQPSDRNATPTQWTEMYKHLSRNDLINQLVEATNRIKELETKLTNIQKAHLAMIQNLNNFNKVLIS